MVHRRVVLDTAAFLDSAQAVSLARAASPAISPADLKTIAQRYLTACYDDLAKAPRLLDGDDVAQLMREVLPRHFGVRDPLGGLVEDVLTAYLEHLEETASVPAIFEQRRAFGDGAAEFRDVVSSGVAHRDGVAITMRDGTVKHRADKVGRNDPCPCGSGKKFKKCCRLLGGT